MSLFNQPPSPTISQPCTPANSSNCLDDSVESESSLRTAQPLSFLDMPDNSSESLALSKGFGTPIQKFTQDLTKSLAWFSITEKLTDKNFMRWSQPILETLMSLDYQSYVKKINHKDEHLPDEQHCKVKFIITTWMLSNMDAKNVS